jgi:putative transposase
MDKRRSEEIAANRLKLITPLLDTGLDKEKYQQLKEELCLQTGLSERTIRRNIQLYEEKGFEGLKPKNAGNGGHSIIPEEVIQEAISLRREVPKRSINDIIKILESLGFQICYYSLMWQYMASASPSAFIFSIKSAICR